MQEQKVTLADLDFGAANLHTILDLHDTGRSIVDFLYDGSITTDLTECLTPTQVKNLQLLPGSGFMPGMANMEYGRKQKLMRHLQRLPGDYVICDLGAGSSYNVIDFFLLADIKCLVLTAEATAVLNGYEFMKNCIYRKLMRGLRKNEKVSSYIEKYRRYKSGQSGSSVQDMIKEIENISSNDAIKAKQMCLSFRPIIYINRDNISREALGNKLSILSRKYLNINVSYGGSIPVEQQLDSCFITGLKGQANSKYWTKIRRIAADLIALRCR